ncbi:MAG: hypothetical protein ACYTFI_06440, partial [Planctomycetota bacterium]
GNIRERSFRELADSPAMSDFVKARPEFCAGCAIEDECLGGCKAAAEACSGSAWACDPFVEAFGDLAVRPT